MLSTSATALPCIGGMPISAFRSSTVSRCLLKYHCKEFTYTAVWFNWLVELFTSPELESCTTVSKSSLPFYI